MASVVILLFFLKSMMVHVFPFFHSSFTNFNILFISFVSMVQNLHVSAVSIVMLAR